MSTGDLRGIMKRCAKFLIRYLILLCLASIVGGGIGGLLGCISFSIGEGEPKFGFDFGAPVGAIIGFVFYAVAHWFVFRKPLWVTSLFLIGGTLAVSLPLSFIPGFGAPFALFGGVLGYWLALVALLVATWGMPGKPEE